MPSEKKDEPPGMKQEGKGRDKLVLAACLASLVAIVVADALTPLAIAFGVLYIIPVGLTIFYKNERLTYAVAIVSSVLDLVFVMFSSGTDQYDIFNRLIALIAIWAITALVIQRKNAEREIYRSNEELKDSKEDLEKNVQERTKELSESESKYRGLFENMQELVTLRRFVYDEHGEIIDRVLVDANPAALNALGESSIDDVRGKRDSEILSPEQAAGRLEAIRKMRNLGEPITMEVHLEANDRDYLMTTALLGKDHEITTSIDITDRKKGEKEIARVASFPEMNPSPIVEVNIDDRITYANPAALSIFPELEVEGLEHPFLSSSKKIIDDLRVGKINDSVREIQVGRSWFHQQFDLVAGTKSVRVYSIKIDAIKEAEHELKESEQRFRSVLDSSLDAIYRFNLKTGRYEYVSPAIKTVLGYSPEEWSSMSFEQTTDLIHPDDIPEVNKALARLLDEGTVEYEYRLRDKSGEYRWVSNHLSLAKDDSGRPLYRDGAISDVTERKKAENELIRSNSELQQFAYVASHDLQEPLRMVTIYLGLLEKKYADQLDEKAKQYMDFAIDGGLRAKDLINDLLDFTRVDSQARPITRTDMEKVLEKVLTGLSIKIKEEHATITHDELPTIYADEVQIMQVLQNLISNAIKFHGDEAPIVNIGCEDMGDRFLFSVSDNGIGIDPQYKDKVFVLFQRLQTRDKYEGTGIGLAIAKKVVERHGGKIWFESEVGKGTTFYFTIPEVGSK